MGVQKKDGADYTVTSCKTPLYKLRADRVIPHDLKAITTSMLHVNSGDVVSNPDMAYCVWEVPCGLGGHDEGCKYVDISNLKIFKSHLVKQLQDYVQ